MRLVVFTATGRSVFPGGNDWRDGRYGRNGTFAMAVWIKGKFENRNN